MKKLLITLFCLSLLGLSACGSDENPLLIGKWDDGAKGIFEFFGDQRIVVYNQKEDQTLAEDYRGQWSLLDDGRIRMELFPYKVKVAAVAYFRDNDNLIMEMKGKKYLLTRWKGN